ncbi:MAG: sigma-70 family RNA polymerase sigma factor [Bacteroidaceae bacterium]|nr:sigma-70 family RNA polymerase sigma factor [Bacteroidaceae bacterium]MDE5999468.1 sigma-70 family RNA polymerase sigma factor [Bacteroidaceae bacterium]
MTAEEFGHIARWLRPQMMRIAMDFFHHREEAEDVVQEVLMRLWQRERTHDATAHQEELAALAIKATKNLCVSVWRKQKLRQGVPIDHHLAGVSSDERADKELLTTEQAQIIDNAISQLPRSEQQLIRLKQNEDLSSDEIALLTGIPIRSVRTMLSSARRNLLKLLK